MIKNGSNALMVQCFADHPGQPLEAPKDQDRKKKGGGKTVSSYFKGQLDDLMTTLYKTEPHFIRCVVPNTHKIPGGVESDLVMHQYQCNGVLAGIAICRAGFPNKMVYAEFKSRYNILAAQLVAKAKNDKAAAAAVLNVVGLEAEKFRLGHTKVFFRAGILGKMEEDLSVSKSELFSFKSNYIENSSSSCLIILGLCHKLCCENIITCFEFRIDHLIWESCPANCNASQDSVTLILMHHKVRFNTSWDFMSVGDNTTDEMRLSFIQSGHKIIKLAFEVGRHSFTTSLLLSVLILRSLKGLSRMVSKTLHHESIASILYHLNNSVIKRIFVLFQPSSKVVRDSCSIMNDCKMSIWIWSGVGFGKLGPLSKHV